MRNFALAAVVVALCASFAGAYYVPPEAVNTKVAYYDYSMGDARYKSSYLNDQAYATHPSSGDSSLSKYQSGTYYNPGEWRGSTYVPAGTYYYDYSGNSFPDTYRNAYGGSTYGYTWHSTLTPQTYVPSTNYETPSYATPSSSYSYPSSTSGSYNYYDSASDYGSYASNSYNTNYYATVPVSSSSNGYGASRYGYGNTFISDSYNTNYDNSFNTYSNPSYSYSYSSPSYTYAPYYSSSTSQYQSYAPSSSYSYSGGYSNPGYAYRYYSYWG